MRHNFNEKKTMKRYSHLSKELNERKIHSNVVRLTTAALVSKSISLKSQVKNAQSVDQKLDFLADQNTIQAMITALSIATASHDPLILKRMRTLFKKV
jgi:hypothetical protein